MNNFTFYSPTLFAFGQGEAARVGSLVRQFGGSRVLLVAGGGSVRKNGAYDAAVDSLKEAGIPWCELWGVQAMTGISGISLPERPKLSARCR